MPNLLQETVKVLANHGKTLEDVLWVGCDCFTIPKEAFIAAADTEYYGGFGGTEVAYDLVIVLEDGSWLERHDYDGSEWWEFKETPLMPEREWDGPIALTVDQAGVDCSGWDSSLLKLCSLADRGE